jgi:hypothetical protein
MQVTNRIYGMPSQLSQGLVQGLVIGLSIVVGWLAVSVMFSRVGTPPAESDTHATANMPIADPTVGTKVSSALNGPRQTAGSNAVRFDWPEEFKSAVTPPPRTVLPPASTELFVLPDNGRSPRPAAAAVPDANDRGFPPRQPPPQAKAATDASDGIGDLLVLPSQPRARGAKDASAAVPVPRRQKPRSAALPAQDQQSVLDFPPDRRPVPRSQKPRADAEAASQPAQDQQSVVSSPPPDQRGWPAPW